MITDLVGQVLGGDFLARHLGRTHKLYRAPGGQEDRFADLLGWQDLNTLLGTHRLEPPRLRLSKDSDTVPTHLYCERRTFRRMPPWDAPLAHLVAEQLRYGATLVLDAIEEMHPPIGDLLRALSRDLRTGVQANAYASWTSTEGFGTHWDDHDVIALQISGAKRWRIYGPTRMAPMYRDTVFDDTPPAEPIEEITLRSGDVLHVPRGWWHAAAASEGEPSLHLSCGLTTHTGVDLLDWLIDDLRAQELLRADVPRSGDEDERGRWQSEIGKILADRLSGHGLIEEYLAARDVADRSAPSFSLPLAVRPALPADPRVEVRLAVPRPVITLGKGTIRLEAGRKRWTLAAAAGPLVRQLATHRTATMAELSATAGLSIEHVAALLTELLQAGVLAAWEPS